MDRYDAIELAVWHVIIVSPFHESEVLKATLSLVSTCMGDRARGSPKTAIE